MNNLQQAFPRRTPQEIKQITRGFYRNLADIIVETIKAYSISKQELQKRVQIIGFAEMDKLYDQKISFMALTPHVANWEWVNLALSIHLRAKVEVIYQKLKNDQFDELMKKIRGRFGGTLIEKKMVLRELIKTRDQVKAIGSLADQSPKKGENRYWTQFLNQETAFFTGSEKIAKKMNFAVFTLLTRRVKRGYYRLEIVPITTAPDSWPENGITKEFAKLVEKTIMENPSDWLWSHKRWKLKKPTDMH